MAKKQLPGNAMPDLHISVGNISTVNFEAPPKRPTVKIRGTGAATKGTKASDKMG
jgi:hypothetical protein